jgi:hypothetical protein
MKRFRYRLIQACAALAATCGLGVGAAGGGEVLAQDNGAKVALKQEALDFSDLLKQCGFACPGDTDAEGVKIKTLVEGNSSISGVASVDAFFGSVLNFRSAAKGVASGIDAQLAAIAVDFKLPADATADQLATSVKGLLDANLEAGFGFQVEPAVCKVDFKAELTAAAKCDATIDPGKAQIACKGGCEVDASAKVSCDASADLRCTVTAPAVECKGECTGSCEADLSVAAACSGTCKGECMGTCSAYSDKAGTQCAGTCTGMCKGSCTAEVSADASCKGKCSGECTVTNPSAGCEGAIRAECKAKANASIMCNTKCSGEFEPPKVKAECQARVDAQAKLDVQCTPPRVSFNYKIKASLSLQDRLQFESGLKSLVSVRLPALKAALKRSELVNDAGADLLTAAGGALKGAVEVAKDKNGVDAKVAFGLGCALDVIGSNDIKAIVDGSTANLKRSVDAAGKINSALKI